MVMKLIPISRKPEELIPLFSNPWAHIWMSLTEWIQIYELSDDDFNFSWDAFSECSIIDDPSAENSYHKWRRDYSYDVKEDGWICDLCGMEITRLEDGYNWGYYSGCNMPHCTEFGKPAPEPRIEITGQLNLGDSDG